MHQWSTTPINNQTADARANWQENQPVSSLNNSSRGLMATAAYWRDDNLGTLVATVSATNVYTVTTGQGLIDPATVGSTPAITHPFSLRVVLPAMPTAVATNAPTIIIDGAAAVPITRRDGTALVDGDLTGLPYELLGDTITSGAYTRARVLNLLPSDIASLQASGFPIGGILPFTGTDTPTGFLNASGSTLSRTSYPKLWAHAQSSGMIIDETTWNGNFAYQSWYTSGDGSTTFRIPYLCGLFLRGLDYGRGLDPGRQIGTSQADAFRSHGHTLANGGAPVALYGSGSSAGLSNTGGAGYYATNIAATGGAETRPYNAAFPFLIRAY